jgi:hypothetical protein
MDGRHAPDAGSRGVTRAGCRALPPGEESVHELDADRRQALLPDNTMVLETRFSTASGSATMVEALVLGANERGHSLGRDAPGLLLRQIAGLTG